jgi:hypothetical protein
MLHEIDGLAGSTIAMIDENDYHESLCPVHFVVGDVVGEGLRIRQLQVERRDCLFAPRNSQA